MMADRSNSFDMAKQPLVTVGDDGQTHPRHEDANGTGGTAGTHEGHADKVPNGRGFGSRKDQSSGNTAAQQSLREMQDSGRAYPPASGTRPPPVAQ